LGNSWCQRARSSWQARRHASHGCGLHCRSSGLVFENIGRKESYWWSSLLQSQQVAMQNRNQLQRTAGFVFLTVTWPKSSTIMQDHRLTMLKRWCAKTNASYHHHALLTCDPIRNDTDTTPMILSEDRHRDYRRRASDGRGHASRQGDAPGTWLYGHH
jgi:hypothetical protein